MQVKLQLLIVITLFIHTIGATQIEKQSINHTVYNEWKTLQKPKISSKGNWVSYEINPYRGDGNLTLYNHKTGESTLFPKGKNANFSLDESVFLFAVSPGFDTLRKLQLKKVKKDKWPKDTLMVVWLNKTFEQLTIPQVKSYKWNLEDNYLAYSLEQQQEKKKKKRKKKEAEILGDNLHILDLNKNRKIDLKLNNINAFDFSAKNKLFYFTTTHQEGKDKRYKIHLFDLDEDCPTPFEKEFTAIKNITFNEQGSMLAFMATTDTNKETRLYDLYLWDKDSAHPIAVFANNIVEEPDNLTIGEHAGVSFSPDGKKLFIGWRDFPIEKEKDTLLATEKAKLDLWHYQDKRLQPQQLKEQKRDKNRNWLSVLHLDENKVYLLENDTLNTNVSTKENNHFELATATERYAAKYNWEYPWKKDYYSVNLQDGTKTLLLEGQAYGVKLTPDGKHFVYFNSKENQYFALNTETKNTACITCQLKDSVNWKDDINGMPFDANPMRSPGMLNENELLLASEFDIWSYNFKTKELHPITQLMGQKNNMKFNIHRLEPDSVYIDLKEVVLVGIDQNNFDEEAFMLNENHQWESRYKTNHKLSNFQKAKAADKIIFRQMNTTDYPDVYYSDLSFKQIKKISTTNPQQEKYIWPTVEQIDWTSYNGEALRGLLYKPDNFDSTKTYPLLVYYYETYSEMKNRHYIPQPTASIIYPTEYASAGYVVFIPDIHYRPGQPGKDAYNSIMSGTDKVLELYPNINSTKMGLQGQSWGGYQTAQLITMTNRYAAAMAGAPVSNMFSAYGGIRWASGLNRMFQYEHTQSRIGKTIWEAPELYVENSPIFHIPNIETPLLIMHNDNDGAVPWYQGIEMFVAMKRLDKPVWMLNYNGDEHNLMKKANRMDLSIRMRQFFDHFLLDKPAPTWLEEGIPAVEKGENYKLD